jgi:hypothetical protein
MTTIIFAKTNAYDSATLCTTMALVTKWINHVEIQGTPFPSNFDFSFFMKGVMISLEMHHSLSTPRAIHLLYRTLHYFPLEQRGLLVQEIFKKHLYPLFFSWSYHIRDLFMAFLLYQVEYTYLMRTTYHLNMAIESQ